MKVYLQICRKTRSSGTGNNSSCTDYQRKQTTIHRKQQFSTLLSNNTNSQQITSNDNNCTFNSAQLTTFLARTADELQRRSRSKAINTPSSSKRSPYIVSSGRP
ncbi:hypothetical protein AVEN_140388-1 [Araneus ventricosus]|uniref:Uncharacterized protein n=1 Tax=Araneus ventricosus TaxID=182803 RepID=A0A4Y2A757_ARAVE|nr:hypothetical protein AVEN_140388-1 [Araneus ventricosus]